MENIRKQSQSYLNSKRQAEFVAMPSMSSSQELEPQKHVTVIYKKPSKPVTKIVVHRGNTQDKMKGNKKPTSFCKVTSKEVQKDGHSAMSSNKKLKRRIAVGDDAIRVPFPSKKRKEVIIAKKSSSDSSKTSNDLADNLHMLSNVADALRTMADGEKKFLEKTRLMLNDTPKKPSRIVIKKPKLSYSLQEHNYSVSLHQNDPAEEFDRRIASSYIKKEDGEETTYSCHDEGSKVSSQTVKPKVIVLPKKRIKYVTSFNSSLVNSDIRKGLIGKDAKAELTDRLRMALHKSKSSGPGSSTGDTMFKVTLVSVPSVSNGQVSSGRVVHSNIGRTRDLEKISELVTSLQETKCLQAGESEFSQDGKTSRHARIIPMSGYPGEQDWLTGSLGEVDHHEMSTSEDDQNASSDLNSFDTRDKVHILSSNESASAYSSSSSTSNTTKRIIFIQSGPLSKGESLTDDTEVSTATTEAHDDVEMSENGDFDLTSESWMSSCHSLKSSDSSETAESLEDRVVVDHTSPFRQNSHSQLGGGDKTQGELTHLGDSLTYNKNTDYSGQDLCKVVLWKSADSESPSSDSGLQDFAVSVEPLSSNSGASSDIEVLQQHTTVEVGNVDLDVISAEDTSEDIIEPRNFMSSASDSMFSSDLSAFQENHDHRKYRKHLYSLADKMLSSPVQKIQVNE